MGTERRGAVPPRSIPGSTELGRSTSCACPDGAAHRPSSSWDSSGESTRVAGREANPPFHPPSLQEPGAAGSPSSATLAPCTPCSGWAARLPPPAPEWAQTSVKPLHGRDLVCAPTPPHPSISSWRRKQRLLGVSMSAFRQETIHNRQENPQQQLPTPGVNTPRPRALLPDTVASRRTDPRDRPRLAAGGLSLQTCLPT